MCTNLDKDFLEIAGKYGLKDGTTLLVAVVSEARISIGNVGDSCAYLLKKNGAMTKVTVDQHPGREDEVERIIGQNGLITGRGGVARVDGSIAVSRAIGDKPFKQFIIPDPECFHHEIQEDDDLLILSSDGLFRVYSEEQLAKEIHELRNDEMSDLVDISRKITEESCTNYNCRDNVSLVIVDLKKQLEDSAARKNEMYSQEKQRTPAFQEGPSSATSLQ